MGVKAILLSSLVALTCWAQQDPMQALMQIRHKVADSIGKLPRYLCTETVERTNLMPDHWEHNRKASSCAEILAAAQDHKANRLFSSDRLRLDVAIIGHSEMYSWVGEGQFEDESLGDLVKHGATSTGAFGSFLQTIFVSDSASFTFKGEAESNGRRILNYAFKVPLWRSGYTVSNKILNRLTGYRGSFEADAATFDLLRLEIQTDPLPAELEMCEADTTLDYTQVRMNNLDFLLPSETEMRIVSSDGIESHNRTVFTGCHQFAGESKLIIDDSDTAANAPISDAKVKPIILPEGLKISVALAQPIDPKSAAAGDPVTGKLTHPIKDSSSALIIPKGTKLNGRIFELRSSYGDERSLEFGLKWESMEIGGASQTVELQLMSAVVGTAKVPLVRGRWPEIGAQSREDDRGAGFFVFENVGKNYQIPAGFEAQWETQAIPVKVPEK